MKEIEDGESGKGDEMMAWCEWVGGNVGKAGKVVRRNLMVEPGDWTNTGRMYFLQYQNNVQFWGEGSQKNCWLGESKEKLSK